MEKLEIKNESFASRCEICHQADCFDVEQNSCSRCRGVLDIQGFKASGIFPTTCSKFSNVYSYWQKRVDLRKLTISTLIVVSLLLSLFFYCQLILHKANNELATLQELQKLHQGQIAYLRTTGKMKEFADNLIILRGYVPDNSGIGASGFDPKYTLEHFDEYLEELKTPKNDYLIILSTIKGTEFSPPTYSIICHPIISVGIFRTGDDCFYIDQTGIIRHSGSPTKIPDANSPPME